MEKIFFQSSLPRTGSTLLQNILAQNPDIYATPTSGLMDLLFASRQNYTNNEQFKYHLEPDLVKKAFLEYCNGAIHSFANAMTDKKYYIDKGRGWGYYIDWLELFMPYKPKIFCMVRDLRDVFASMEKNYRKSPERDIGMVDWMTLRGTTIEKRMDFWATNIPVGISLDRLYSILQTGNAHKILFIRYEDLCLRPETELARLYNYLEIPYFPHNFDHIPQLTHEDDRPHMGLGDHIIRNRLEIKQSDANQILGEGVCDWIYDRYKWFYDFFKYNK